MRCTSCVVARTRSGKRGWWLLKTPFETLYEGQRLFDEIAELMTAWGFRYAGALDQLTHPADGRILQADSIFLKVMTTAQLNREWQSYARPEALPAVELADPTLPLVSVVTPSLIRALYRRNDRQSC